MTADELLYQGTVRACYFCGQVLAPYDLPAMIKAIEHAETVGPVLDPTLYRDKVNAMLQDKALLEAALPLWKLHREVFR